MGNSIFINDQDPEKDQKVADFLEPYQPKDGGEKIALVTDSDHDKLFCKLAEEWEPNNFSEFENKVKETFNGKLDSQLEKWAKKLTLDRTRLRDIFVQR